MRFPVPQTAVKAHLQIAGAGHCLNWMNPEAYFGTVFALFVLPQFDQGLGLMVVLGQVGEYQLGLYLHVGRVVLEVLTPFVLMSIAFFPRIIKISLLL